MFSGKSAQKSPDGTIWVSDDGISWDLSASSAVFDVRTRAPAIVFNDKLWLIGGSNLEYAIQEPITFYNDVWNTADGMVWEEIKPNSRENEDCPTCPGNTRGWYLGWAFKGNLWLFGMASDIYNYRMFYSNNGREWTECDTLPSKRLLLEYTPFQNKMWAVSIPSSEKNAPIEEKENSIWTTEDGFSWYQAQNKPAFSPVKNFHMEAFQNRLWLLGGAQNEIWSSENGIDWIKVAEAPELGSLARADFFAFRNKLWFFGKTGCGNVFECYFSQYTIHLFGQRQPG